MVVWPTAIAMGPDAAPEVTVTPFTFMVAAASAAVGVSVTDVVVGVAVVV